jgi:hypothetical protein
MVDLHDAALLHTARMPAMRSRLSAAFEIRRAALASSPNSPS